MAHRLLPDKQRLERRRSASPHWRLSPLTPWQFSTNVSGHKWLAAPLPGHPDSLTGPRPAAVRPGLKPARALSPSPHKRTHLAHYSLNKTSITVKVWRLLELRTNTSRQAAFDAWNCNANASAKPSFSIRCTLTADAISSTRRANSFQLINVNFIPTGCLTHSRCWNVSKSHCGFGGSTDPFEI